MCKDSGAEKIEFEIADGPNVCETDHLAAMFYYDFDSIIDNVFDYNTI